MNFEILAGHCKHEIGVWTNRFNHVDVTGFVDSDYAKDSDKGRSITGYAFLEQRCVVSWKATLQHVVALSTTETEYMALTEVVKEAIRLRGLLNELGLELNTVAVNCDNQGTIHLSRNHVFHERTKHINVRYHFIGEVLEAKTVKFLKVSSEHNVADALTKVRQFQHGLNEQGVVILNNSSLLVMVEPHLKYGIESLDGQSICYLGRMLEGYIVDDKGLGNAVQLITLMYVVLCQGSYVVLSDLISAI
uniref:Retrovirus-related Pol polyprotein from transposon TNT 1-94 n=1 Tax=Tanacetum cinerariifolium TaxID=118510 RepID=A0A699I094_TANCI|nr:retrovirus-related Pol polyprotein from transposon TNT 1-94 [Tanacetum cinerariifolium]